MKNRLKVVAIVLALALVFAGGYVMGSLEKPVDKSVFSEDFMRRYGEIAEILQEHYYEGVQEGQLEDGMLHGLASSLGDPYTRYMNADELTKYNSDQAESYVGIGVVIQLDESYMPEAARIYKNSPAQKAGIQVGDVFTSVDGEEIKPHTELSTVSGKLRGEAGTKVNVTARRGTETLTFTIERAAVDIEYVESRMLTSSIGYLSLSEFSMHCNTEVKQGIEALQKQGMKKLVLDLRNNPGGYVNPAIDIADIFLDKGLVVYTKYADGSREDYTSDAQKLDIPLVILVNGYSASASEIVTGALHDRGAAKVVGTKTYGKGIIQMPFPLSSGGQVIVTIAKYYLPNGDYIHGKGIMPDVSVDLPQDVLDGTVKLTDKNDTQIQKAIELLQ